MLYSIVNGQRTKATPSVHGTCPHCKQETISKCGSIKIWHWAHKMACPYETEPETDWHLEFKELAENHGCASEQNMGKHIADAINWNTQTVFEFQHSPISSEDLISRCEYAKDAALKINWVFDFRERKNDFKKKRDAHDIMLYNEYFKHPEYNILESRFNFYSAHIKKSINTLFRSDKPIYGNVYFDLGDMFLDENNRPRKVLLKIISYNEQGYGYAQHYPKDKIFIN